MEAKNPVRSAFTIFAAVIGVIAVGLEWHKTYPAISAGLILVSFAYFIFEVCTSAGMVRNVPGMLRFLFAILLGSVVFGYAVPRLAPDRNHYIIMLPETLKLTDTLPQPVKIPAAKTDKPSNGHSRTHKRTTVIPASPQPLCSIRRTGGVKNQNTVNCNFGSSEGGVVEIK